MVLLETILAKCGIGDGPEPPTPPTLPASALLLQADLLSKLDGARLLLEAMAALAQMNPRGTALFEDHAKLLGANLEKAGEAAQRFFWAAECDGEA